MEFNSGFKGLIFPGSSTKPQIPKMHFNSFFRWQRQEEFTVLLCPWV